MNTFLLLLAYSIEIALLVDTFRRFGLLPSPTVLLFTILAEQITLWLVSSQILNNDFVWTYSHGGLYTQFYRTEFFYAVLFLFFYACHFGLGRAQTDARFATTINVSAQNIESLNIPMATALLAVQILFIYLVNWSIVWRNNQYLAMGDASVVMVSARFGFMLAVLLASGLLAAILSALNFARDNRLWGWLFGALLGFPLAYQIGAHSRTSAVFPVMFALTLHAAAPRRFTATKLGSIAATILLVAAALVGRGNYAHGIATVPQTIAGAFTDVGRTSNDLVTNIFEGSTVLAESLDVSSDFPTRYKVLSLMPTPSFVDGFAEIQKSAEHRLSYYAPMSGYAEVYDFGLVYLAAFAAIVLISIRLTFAQSRRNYTIFLIANLFLFIGFFILNTYSVRTGLKWFWLSDVLCLLAFGYSILRGGTLPQLRLPGLRPAAAQAARNNPNAPGSGPS